MPVNVKLAQRRTVPLSLWERGDGGEGTGMESFVIRGGYFSMPVRDYIQRMLVTTQR